MFDIFIFFGGNKELHWFIGFLKLRGNIFWAFYDLLWRIDSTVIFPFFLSMGFSLSLPIIHVTHHKTEEHLNFLNRAKAFRSIYFFFWKNSHQFTMQIRIERQLPLSTTPKPLFLHYFNIYVIIKLDHLIKDTLHQSMLYFSFLIIIKNYRKFRTKIPSICSAHEFNHIFILLFDKIMLKAFNSWMHSIRASIFLHQIFNLLISMTLSLFKKINTFIVRWFSLHTNLNTKTKYSKINHPNAYTKFAFTSSMITEFLKNFIEYLWLNHTKPYTLLMKLHKVLWTETNWISWLHIEGS